jgi:hypothetical protein
MLADLAMDYRLGQIIKHITTLAIGNIYSRFQVGLSQSIPKTLGSVAHKKLQDQS